MTPAEAAARTLLKQCVDQPPSYLSDYGGSYPCSSEARLSREQCLALLDVLERWRLALSKLSTMALKGEAESRKVQALARDALYPKAVNDV